MERTEWNTVELWRAYVAVITTLIVGIVIGYILHK